jgi:hypothetical protein
MRRSSSPSSRDTGAPHKPPPAQSAHHLGQRSQPAASNPAAQPAAATLFQDPLLKRVESDREILRQAGFRPVPLYSVDVTTTRGGTSIAPTSRGKVPLGGRWIDNARNGKLPSATPDVANTGILCDGLRVIDLDIDDAAIAGEVEKLAETMLGSGALVRFRDNSPRRAIVYRAAVGEPGKVTKAGAAGKIEVLGRGQQVQVLGTHYSGLELRWRPWPPGAIQRAQLPTVTGEQVSDFLNAAAGLLNAPAVNAASGPTPSAGSAGAVLGPPQPPVKPIPGTAPPNASNIFNLPPRPAGMPTGDLWLNAAAMHGMFSFAEVEAAVEAIPDGCPGHSLGMGDPWRAEFLFPLADYAAWHPEHRSEISTLFDTHTRRIADPVLVAAWPGGEAAYFAAATARFDAEVRQRANGNVGGRDDLIRIGRLIHSALGNRKEAVDAGWGGRWDGKTKARRQAEAAARVGNGQLAPFFTPVRTASPDLHRVAWLADGVLIAGDLTVLAGLGGGAKTAFAVSLSTAIAAGRAHCGPIELHEKPGGLRVAFISAEEDLNRLGLLVAAAAAELQLDAAERAAVENNLWLHDARDSGWMLGMSRPDEREAIAREEHDRGLAVLRDELAKLNPVLVVMDTAAGLLAVPNENDNNLVTSILARVRRLAAAQRCAVLLLHHTPKMTRETAAAQRGEPTLVRGGGAWANTARVVLSITNPPSAEGAKLALEGADPTRIRRLEHVKVNDQLHMKPIYFETKSVPVPVSDGTNVSVRAVAFLRPGASAVAPAVVAAVMGAITAGTTDQHGARVPLSRPGSGGAQNHRDATPHVAAALQSANAGLNAEQATQAAPGVVHELRDMGYLAEEQFVVPKYDAAGRRDGNRTVKGLVCRREPPSGEPTPPSMAATTAPEAPTSPEQRETLGTAPTSTSKVADLPTSPPPSNTVMAPAVRQAKRRKATEPSARGPNSGTAVARRQPGSEAAEPSADNLCEAPPATRRAPTHEAKGQP